MKKLALLLLFTGSLQLFAITNGQVKISVRDAPLEKVFDIIKRQAGMHVFYQQKDIAAARKVTIHLENASVATVLDKALEGQELTYAIDGKNVFIKKVVRSFDSSNILPDSLITVRGKLLNEKNSALSGATIVVKEINRATISNDNGEFQLSGVPPNATLRITCINYLSQEIKVNGRTNMELALDINPGNLQEVVVMNTGYQQISKERFVGAVSVLDSAAFHRRAGMDIISRLDGTVTGILFDKKNTGLAYADNIQIRGLSTISTLPQSASSAPLIIVDNFPFRQDLSVINPNDVESITVLKDAAAASIWGAQAGNGVIVITTKKGKYNQQLSVTVSSNVTVQQKPDQYYYPQMSVNDFIDAEISLFNNGAYEGLLGNPNRPAITPVIEMLTRRKAGLISSADSMQQLDVFRKTDVRGELNSLYYRPSVLQQHYIGLSGGNTLLRYNLSVGYNRSLKNKRYSDPDDQLTVNSMATFKPVKDLEVTAGINYSQSANRSNTAPFPNRLYPYAHLADESGYALPVAQSIRQGYADTTGNGNLLDWNYRPLDELHAINRNDVSKFIQLTTAINYRVTSWLNAAFNYQLRNENVNFRTYNGLEAFATRDLINRFTNLNTTVPALRNPVPVGGILDLGESLSKSQNIRGQLSSDNTFHQVHHLKAMLAAEVSQSEITGNRSRYYGYSEDDGTFNNSVDYQKSFPNYMGLANGQIPNANTVIPKQVIRIVSFIGNLSYTYNGIYNFYASARRDGTNSFGVNTNRKWKPLWSMGASWDIARAKFYNIKWMPSLRMRASIGYTGNPGNVTGLPTITYSSMPITFTNRIAAFINDAPNPDLRWEKVRIINGGVDFSLFRNRLQGSFDIFSKKSSDIISTSPFAPSTGVNLFITNIAQMKTKGFEINLTSKNIQGQLSWETGFGLSYAKSMITKLYTRPNAYYASQFVGYGLNPLEGKIAWGLSSYRWGGLDPATGDPRGVLNKDVSNNYEAIFKDSVGNQVFHGSAIPLYSGFIRNTFSWKNFSLSANITYRFDFYFRKPALSYTGIIESWNGISDFEKRWKKPGDETFTNVPSFSYPLDPKRDEFYQYSEINVLRGDNIRLQDIRLQYNFSKKTIPFFNTVSAFLYVNDLNLILWRKNSEGLDPDFTGGLQFSAPTPKSFTLGMSLNF